MVRDMWLEISFDETFDGSFSCERVFLKDDLVVLDECVGLRTTGRGRGRGGGREVSLASYPSHTYTNEDNKKVEQKGEHVWIGQTVCNTSRVGGV